MKKVDSLIWKVDAGVCRLPASNEFPVMTVKNITKRKIRDISQD